MRTNLVALAVLAIVLVSVIAYTRAQTTNLSLPVRTGVCLGQGASFTMALSASELSNIYAWQFNVTYPANQVVLTAVAFGAPFTGSGTYGSYLNKTGSVVPYITFEGSSNTYSSASPVTMVTFTFKTLIRNIQAGFHIVLKSENSAMGSILLGPDPFTSQTYTTTDGQESCSQSPSP